MAKYKYLFQQEMEEIGDWFADNFKRAELEQKVSFNPKTTPPSEEYMTVVKIKDKELGSGLRIPAGWETWEPSLVAEHRASFLSQQKAAISNAVMSLLNGS